MSAAPAKRGGAVAGPALWLGWWERPCSSNELPQDVAQQCGPLSTLHSLGSLGLLLLLESGWWGGGVGGNLGRGVLKETREKERETRPPGLLPKRAACELVDKVGWEVWRRGTWRECALVCVYGWWGL